MQITVRKDQSGAEQLAGIEDSSSRNLADIMTGGLRRASTTVAMSR